MQTAERPDADVRTVPAGSRLVDRILSAGSPTALALTGGGTTLDHDQLRRLVGVRARSLGLGHRSLVILGGDRCIDWAVTYLALLAEGHVPLLVEQRHMDRMATAWAPDAVIEAVEDGVTCSVEDRRPRDLHPDLALLLSTSGSTGSPKLVRLSQRNLVSNAEAIVTYLELGPADRTITSLPLHYCYGLSVLNSHLLAGGSLTMTDLSVVEPCFAAAAHRSRITTLAGVPHTFDMIERSGAERLHVRELRLLTQAGGRFPADEAARWLDRCDRWGVDLYLMYGQTEATARMAYLPPGSARQRADVLGRAIPGGMLRIDPDPSLPDGTGELVYRGPNVMMGYAAAERDLGQGHLLDELRTGDLARPALDGTTFEIVGRRSRFAKLLGLRIDLDELERATTGSFGQVAVAGDDSGLVAVTSGGHAGLLRSALAARSGLPESLVDVMLGEVPRTASGKVDHAEVLRRASAARASAPASAAPVGDGATGRVTALYRDILGTVAPDGRASFVTLGGDSLSYVECSVRLEQVLGPLPPDWHLLTIDELESGKIGGRPGLDTTIVLRALGISTVVATHMGLASLPGGAHLLLAVAGFNFSRFNLSIAGARARFRAATGSVVRVAVPTMACVALAMVTFGGYGLATLGLVNSYLGPSDRGGGRWQYWFVEAYVQLYLLVTALTLLPLTRRLDRRFPFGTPLAVLVATLALRAGPWDGVDALAHMRVRTHMVAWLFVLGWLVHRSLRPWQRAVTAAACVVSIPGFFDNWTRECYLLAGLVLLTSFRTVPVPRALVRPLAVLSAASLWILLSHFRLHRQLSEVLPLPLAYPATLVGGVAAWWAVTRATAVLGLLPVGLTRCAGGRRPGSPRGPATTPG